ncbi:hypothetical protein CLOM_g4632, partial [Closterium sp. NIES-68]
LLHFHGVERNARQAPVKAGGVARSRGGKCGAHTALVAASAVLTLILRRRARRSSRTHGGGRHGALPWRQVAWRAPVVAGAALTPLP